MADAPGYAPLTAALVRRAPAPDWSDDCDETARQAQASPAWHADVRLFAVTWAAGFVFFLTFIA